LIFDPIVLDRRDVAAGLVDFEDETGAGVHRVGAADGCNAEAGGNGGRSEENGCGRHACQYKAPRTKLQAPEKHQAPSFNRFSARNQGLGFGASLELRGWSLELRVHLRHRNTETKLAVSFILPQAWLIGRRS